MVATQRIDGDSPGLLTSHNVKAVFHYVPLHYLLFVARAGALFSKDELHRQGFGCSHFRSTSRRADERRGFSGYVHLTLDECPPILRAKLAAGFPHFELRIPAAELEQTEIHLCRYNIAKSRYIRRPPAAGPAESAANGYYHGLKQLPTAETKQECEQLLRHNFGTNMIEVLVPGRFDLPSGTEAVFFNPDDISLADALLQEAGIVWRTRLSSALPYVRGPRSVALVEQFLRHAAGDADWRGDGLEFDRL